MPNTPVLALPYPSASDTADVPRDIQALATKLDGLDLNAGAELGHWQITADVTFTATSSATAQTVIAGASVTYDGKPILVEFSAPFVNNSVTTGFVFPQLFDGATLVASLAAVPAGGGGMPVRLATRITPTAAAHTYNIRAYVNGGTGTVSAGAPYVPAFLRVTRARTS